MRIRFLRYNLVFTFDSEAARDQAFDQIRASANLVASPGGAAAAAPA